MTNPDTNEELVAVGTWLYADTTECIVHIVKSVVAYGSGDYQASAEIRENRKGTFYYLKFFSPANSGQLSSKSGAFVIVGLAKKAAKNMCPKLAWK